MKLLKLFCTAIVMRFRRGIVAAELTTRPTQADYLRIAEEVDVNLRNEILDKFFPTTSDDQNGGFLENYGLDWTRLPGRGKSIVYQSRLTWTSAEAARRFPDKADLYLAMTRRGANCLAEKMWDKQSGGFFWSINENGQPGSLVKQMYGHAFGIYALAASYQATRDSAALNLARKAFQWLEDHAHDKERLGYIETIGPDGEPSYIGSSSTGAGANQKSMNTSIHILEALTGLYQVWPDTLVKSRLQEMLDICRDRIYSDPGYLTQFLSADWRRIAGADSFGHDVEAGYLLVEAADALGQGTDPRNWTIARRLLDHAMQYGWDSKRGGLYDSGQMDAAGVVTGNLVTNKIWWVQAEHLNALLLQHEHVGGEAEKYWSAFVKQWAWIRKHQVDPKFGGWWPIVRADGTPVSRVKADMWTECYHQGRAMMNVSTRLRRLAAGNR